MIQSSAQKIPKGMQIKKISVFVLRLWVFSGHMVCAQQQKTAECKGTISAYEPTALFSPVFLYFTREMNEMLRMANPVPGTGKATATITLKPRWIQHKIYRLLPNTRPMSITVRTPYPLSGCNLNRILTEQTSRT